MTKQEWRDKIKELRLLDGREAEGILADGSRLSDFFYSLHLKELQKIRENMRSDLDVLVSLVKDKLERETQVIKETTLLALTDENI